MTEVINKWLDRPVTLLVIIIIILLLGSISIYNLPIELSPSVDFPKLTISTYFSDSTPEMIEALISAPIESRMQELTDLENIESVSDNNVSRVILEFNQKADMPFMVFRVNEILADYKNWLPKGVTRPVIEKYIPGDFANDTFLSYQLLCDLPEYQIYELVEKSIKPSILNVKGVAAVEVFGLREPVIQILIHLSKLKQYNISLTEVRRAIDAVDIDGGKLYKDDFVVNVKLHNSFKDVNDIKKVPVKSISNRIIYLNQIAQVKEGYNKLRYIKHINGKRTVLITIEKESGANTIGVADRVFEAVKEIQSNLPVEVNVIKVDDASLKIRNALHELSLRTLIALVTIFLLLTIVLKSLPDALIILFSIIFSVLLVFIFIAALNYSINLLTIAGLALGLGLIVDNAIIVYDNIERNSTLMAISAAVAEVVPPMVAATITTLAAILPFIFLAKEMQIYYIPFGVVVGATLIVSLFFSIFFIPASRFHLKHRIKIHHASKITIRIKSVYEKILILLIRFRKLIIVIVILIFGIPLWLLPKSLKEKENSSIYNNFILPIYNSTIGSSFYQNIRQYTDPIFGGSSYLFMKYVDKGNVWQWGNSKYLMVSLQLPDGHDMELCEKLILPFEDIALSQDGVDKVETTIGHSFAYVRIDFLDETAYGNIPFILKDKLIARAVEVGGVAINVYGYGKGFSGCHMENISNFRVKFVGYNYRALKNIAQKFAHILEENRRVRNIDIDAPIHWSPGDLFQLEMNLNRKVIGNYGLTPAQIMPYLLLYTNESLGNEYIQIGHNEKLLSIKVDNYEDAQLDDLMKKWFYEKGTSPFRLNEFAKVTKKKLLNEIHRINQEYIRILTFDFIGPYHFGLEYLDKVINEFELPAAYHIERVTFRQFEREDQKNLTWVILLGLLLIYMVTASLYESFRDPFLIFLTIPFGLIGIFLIFYFSKVTFSQSAYIGLLFISGVVVNNSIILINRFKLNLNHGQDIMSAVITGALHHARPIILTTSTTILGFLPMVVIADKNAGDLWYALSLTGIGGMISSNIFILLILPVLFYSVEKKARDK